MSVKVENHNKLDELSMNHFFTLNSKLFGNNLWLKLYVKNLWLRARTKANLVSELNMKAP